MELKSLRAAIEAAREGKTTLVIKNAKVVNVFTDEIQQQDVAIYEDYIVGVGEYSGENEIDAQGLYLTPGLIDAHVHIESSMVVPASYAAVVIPHGTTTIIADPHEIANVCGMEGIQAMLDYSEGLPLNVYLMLPSCVPATSFEHSGAVLNAETLKRLKSHARVLGLGEVMNYMGVVNCDEDMLEKLSMFSGKCIDGHAPLISGRDLNAYYIAGPRTDHECSNYAEVLEKLRAGVKVQIRVGSAARGMNYILQRIAEDGLPVENLLLCTDDKHLENICEEGHINNILAMAVRAGISPAKAVRMATINAARTYGLKTTGAVAPGYRADLALFEDIKDFKAKMTIVGGKVYKGIETKPISTPHSVVSSVNIKPLTKADLRLEAREQMPVIKLIEGQLVTELAYRSVKRQDGCFVPADGLSKLAVIERHHATGRIGLGIVEGMPICHGALAATVAHDSHNIVVIGDNDEDMLTAVQSLVDCKGGYVAVNNGVVLARLPLPIAGLMSDAPIDDVLARQRALLDAAKAMGVAAESDPLIALSFMALPVIPAVRLTDMGLFDVTKMKFIDEEVQA